MPVPRELWGVEFNPDGSGAALFSSTTRVGKVDFITPIVFGSLKQAEAAAKIISDYHHCEAQLVRFREVTE